MPDISIVDLNLERSIELARILSVDEVLHSTLSPGQEMQEVQGQEYFDTCIRWAARRHGICHAILLDDRAIGSISLSNTGADGGSAKVGYWIGSEHWAKGYATIAFQLIMDKARVMDIKTLTCTIQADNIASLALWKRQGAAFREDGIKVTPVLDM